MQGTLWFRRLVGEAKRISPYINFKQIRNGFFRIYYKQAYIGECYSRMPQFGYDIAERAQGLEDYSFFQQHHDTTDSTLRMKNFVEGYWETVKRLRTKVFMFRHNREFYETARRGYSQMRIK